MTREQLEHIIRACGAITNEYEFVIVGSQSILGAYPNPDPIFTVSAEADIYPLNAPELWDRIDGGIGEGSAFHDLYGYYAQGVAPETTILPVNWKDRLHRVQTESTNGLLGLCLDVVDLFLSKAAAGRAKDKEFCVAMVEHNYVTPSQVFERLPEMPLSNAEKSRLRRTIQRWLTQRA